MTDVVADLHLGLKELAAEDRSGWVPLALSDRLRGVVGVHERSEVELIRTVAGWDRRTAWAEEGAVTAVSWLKHDLNMSPGQAGGLVHLARLYDEHRPVRDGLDGGQLSVAAARLLLKASRGRQEMFARCVEGLTDLACELPYVMFADVIGNWIELLDEREPHDDSDRHLSVSEVGDQSVTEIVGSPDDGRIIRAALEALDSPDPEDCPEGPRTRPQRWYDLTIDIFRRALADKLGDDPTAMGGVDIIVDPKTAAELTSEDEPSLDEQLAPYVNADAEALDERRLEHPDGAKATKLFAKLLLCSGFIRRIILDTETGAVLDVGRAQRRFTKRQWRALVVRDGGCVFPGCDRKPKWTDAHHLEFWVEHDGPTDIENGCLLCRRHHTLIHHRGWRLERDKRTGIFTATAPDGRQFFRRPNERC
jgi:hypothetical protein